MPVDQPFIFRRVSDGLTYRFEPTADHRWKRTDLDLWAIRLEERGWAIVDDAGVEVGWPIDENDAFDISPPVGRWRSEKDGRSYEYDLEYVPPLA